MVNLLHFVRQNEILEGENFMKKVLSMILLLVMLFSLCACGEKTPTDGTEAPQESSSNQEKPAGGEPVVLRFAFSEAPESQTAQVMNGAKQRIEERTEGRVICEPHWANELGSINDCIEQITMGGNIVSATSASSWAPYGCPDMTAMDSMFAFSSIEEIANFNKSEMWKNMVKELEEKGNIHMICMNWAAAPRVVLSNKPVNSVSDLKGLLVRVPTDTYAAWFSALGASPVSGIPFAEVYTNIESGVIEAAEAPFATLSDFSLQEVAKYAYASNHTYASGCLGTSTKIWNMMSEEDRAIVEEELSAAGEEYAKLCAASNAEYMKKFEEAGVTIVEPSKEDVEAMQNAASKAAAALGLREGIMEEIKANSKA